MNKRQALSTDYSTRIEEIKRELQNKTLGEVERDQHIVKYDYSGVGFGHNLKPHHPKDENEALRDIKTPELDKLEKLAEKSES